MEVLRTSLQSLSPLRLSRVTRESALKSNNSRSLTASTLVLMATCVTDAGNSFAAAADDSVEEVQITTNRLEETLPQNLAQYGTRVDTITREDYANLALVDVAEGLETLVPGLFVLPKNGPFDYADISLQGSRSATSFWSDKSEIFTVVGFPF